MDMYQKRKMRAEKKKNEDKESFSKTSINWVMLFIENVDISSFL